MTDENAPESGVGTGRWILLAFLVGLGLIAYFTLAPRVPPAVVPYVTSPGSLD